MNKDLPEIRKLMDESKISLKALEMFQIKFNVPDNEVPEAWHLCQRAHNYTFEVNKLIPSYLQEQLGWVSWEYIHGKGMYFKLANALLDVNMDNPPEEVFWQIETLAKKLMK
jgi:hypothetical protein